MTDTLHELTDDDGLDLGGGVRLVRTADGAYAYTYDGPKAN